MCGGIDDSAGVSYEKTETCVPATALTVRKTSASNDDETTRIPHASMVELLQLVVAHSPPATVAVEEYTTDPNSSPVTVTDAPPDRGVFDGSSIDTTGELKLSMLSLVAATLATVTTLSVTAIVSTFVCISTDVLDVHAVLPLPPSSLLRPATAVAVASKLPNDSPLTVTRISADHARLRTSAPDTTGLSKLSTLAAVPITAATVTSIALPLVEGARHITDVLDDHDAVLHATADTDAVAVSEEWPKLSPLTVTVPSVLRG